MVRDYSYRYNAVLGARQKVSGRRTRARAGQESNRGENWLLKGTGVIVTVAMLLGLISSYWFDANIRRGLDELGQLQQQQQEFRLRHDQMLARRNELLSRTYLVAAAEKLELFPITAKQRKLI